MRYTFTAPDAHSARQTQLYRTPGARAIYHAGWKAVAADGPAGAGRWELYHVGADRAEARNLAAAYPEKVAELVTLWEAAAVRPGSPAQGPGRGGTADRPLTSAAAPAPRPAGLAHSRERTPVVAASREPGPDVHRSGGEALPGLRGGLRR